MIASTAFGMLDYDLLEATVIVVGTFEVIQSPIMDFYNLYIPFFAFSTNHVGELTACKYVLFSYSFPLYFCDGILIFCRKILLESLIPIWSPPIDVEEPKRIKKEKKEKASSTPKRRSKRKSKKAKSAKEDEDDDDSDEVSITKNKLPNPDKVQTFKTTLSKVNFYSLIYFHDDSFQFYNIFISIYNL